VRIAVLVLLVAAACRGDRFDYTWDDRTVLCSKNIDDLTSGINWTQIDGRLRDARDNDWVAIFHAHVPGETVTPETIERLLSLADAYHLPTITFRELDPGAAPRGGIALGFDDSSAPAWFTLRDIFRAHDAHITFFVSRFFGFDDEARADLAQLAADGADIEAHTVNHLHGPQFVAEHGLEAYIDEEVLPSIDLLEQAGYPRPTTLAYPWGEHTAEIDAAVLQHVGKVRATNKDCPD